MAQEIPAVSVVIPMYNTENYISECLESLLNQTLQNFEVIVADDCSTDNSVAVAEKMTSAFAAKNLKLSIIKLKQNSGCPGIPRNIALDFAKGKYIYFLDSDDFLDETALEDFYKVAEKFSADVVHAQKSFRYKEINGKFEDNLLNLDLDEILEIPTLETFDIAQRVTNFVGKKYSTLMCNKFFRREFLTENDIKIPAIRFSEDCIFSLMCVTCAKNYVRIPFIGHHYRIRPGSITCSPDTTLTASLNLIEGIYCLDNFMKKQIFFSENPHFRYSILDYFNQAISMLISEHIFLKQNLDPAEVYSFYSDEIFTLNPEKNIPLTAYLFVSTNIYKLFIKQQNAEIENLKKLLIKLNNLTKTEK